MKKVFVFIMLILLVDNLFAQKTKLMLKTGHRKDITQVSISPDQNKLFTVSNDCNAILWDITTGRELLSLENIMNGEFYADSKSLLIEMRNTSFKKMDLTGKILKTFPVADSLIINELNHKSRIFPELGLRLLNLDLVNTNTHDTVLFKCREYGCSDLAILKNQVAIGGKGGMIAICDAGNGNQIRKIDLNISYENIDAINFSEDNNKLLVMMKSLGGPGTVKIVDFESGNILLTHSFSDILYNSVLSPDGQYFTVITNGKVLLFNTVSGSQIWSIDNNQKYSSINFYDKGNKYC
jgi:WD40 repeat protein